MCQQRDHKCLCFECYSLFSYTLPLVDPSQVCFEQNQPSKFQLDVLSKFAGGGGGGFRGGGGWI